MTTKSDGRPVSGRVTQNKLALFREFAQEVGCTLILEKNLPRCLDTELPRSMAGLYIQLRRRGDFYVGESINILERQKEHMAKGTKIAALAVRGVPMSDTKERKRLETAAIAAALKKGLLLANESKVKLAEGLNRQAEQLSADAALEFLTDMDIKAVSEFGTGGWLEKLEEARSKATSADWEKYANFRASSMSYAALLAVQTFVRRTIPEPEQNYGQTWCICLNTTGIPGKEWISVRTQIGTVFAVDVLQTEDDTKMRARVWIDQPRLMLFGEYCQNRDSIMRMQLGITQGVFDLCRRYFDLNLRSVMDITFFVQRTPRQIAWEMDLDQVLELFQSRWGLALIAPSVHAFSGKPTGEGFRLGRMLF